jgi:hypothetical protein
MYRDRQIVSGNPNVIGSESLPVRRFYDTVQGPRLRGMRAAFTNSCPGEPAPPVITEAAYAYYPHELGSILAKAPASIVLYRGLVPDEPAIEGYHLYREHLTLFSSSRRGTLDLKRGDVSDLLAGRLRRWDRLGHGSGTIRLLAHGAPVNHETLLAGLAQRIGLEKIIAPVELYPSYRALAEAARGCPDCIVLGMRPSWLGDSGLLPVTLEGIAPWLPGPARLVPSLDISLVSRREAWKSPEHAAAVERILTTIGGRLEADAAAFRALAPAAAIRAA